MIGRTLADLDAIAMWRASFPCDAHGEPFCVPCKPRELSQSVYVTSGGSAYHRTLDCDGLVDGQAFIARRGGTPAIPMTMSVSAAQAENRSPCLICWQQP